MPISNYLPLAPFVQTVSLFMVKLLNTKWTVKFVRHRNIRSNYVFMNWHSMQTNEADRLGSNFPVIWLRVKTRSIMTTTYSYYWLEMLKTYIHSSAVKVLKTEFVPVIKYIVFVRMWNTYIWVSIYLSMMKIGDSGYEFCAWIPSVKFWLLVCYWWRKKKTKVCVGK